MHAVSLYYRAALDSGECIFALSSAAVQWCWVTAHLYEEEIFTGVFAATQFML